MRVCQFRHFRAAREVGRGPGCVKEPLASLWVFPMATLGWQRVVTFVGCSYRKPLGLGCRFVPGCPNRSLRPVARRSLPVGAAILHRERMTFVIGIAGGTGSGKTTIARKIEAAVASDKVNRIEHDSYYRDRSDLTYEERCGLNFDHPSSLETSLMVEHVAALRAGKSVEVPSYNFTTHQRNAETVTLDPKAILIVEGILVLAEKELREMMDIKIFVDTDSDIRAFRRIRRDIEQRGRSFDSIREQYYKTVRPMHLRFVEPSKRWADLIVPEGGDNRVALDVLTAKLQAVV